MSKKKKFRHCPALKKEITAQECGSGRQSRIACPALCSFSPFNPENYDEFGEIETRVIDKIRERMFKQMPESRRRRMAILMDSAASGQLQMQYTWLAEIFRHSEPHQGRLFEKWEAEGWAGLNNDERVLVQGYAKMRPALLEVQCVLDDRSVQVVDLLQPGALPFVIVDRAMAATARRFQSAIAWICAAPHYFRVGGSAMMIEPIGPCDALETLVEISRHFGGPEEPSALPEWIWDNFTRLNEALKAVGTARWADTVKRLDAIQATADYRITGSHVELGEVLEFSDGIDEADIEQAHVKEGFERRYDVFDRRLDTEPQTPSGAVPQPLIGSILLGKTRLRAEAGSAKLFSTLKDMLQAVAGDRVTFVSERVQDLAAELLERRAPAWDASLVPPRLLEQPGIIELQTSRTPITVDEADEVPPGEQFIRTKLSGFIDEKIPALNNRTPREAAADPAARPALVAFMKQYVKHVDDLRYKKRLDIDLKSQLEALGLHEIIFPPPPLPDVSEDEQEDNYNDRIEDDDDDDAPPPGWSLETALSEISPAEMEQLLSDPPPRPMVTPDDIDAGMRRLQETFKSPDDLDAWFEDRWADLYHLLDTAIPEEISDEAFYVLTVQATRAAWVLFPGERARAEVNPRRLALYMAMESREIMEAGQSGRVDSLEDYSRRSPQPALSETLVGQVLHLCEREDPVIDETEVIALVPLVKAVVRELCMLPPR